MRGGAENHATLEHSDKANICCAVSPSQSSSAVGANWLQLTAHRTRQRVQLPTLASSRMPRYQALGLGMAELQMKSGQSGLVALTGKIYSRWLPYKHAKYRAVV
jgi:hypothetical protein